jgi:hypothetical protein
VKDLRGRATTSVSAPLEDCIATLAAVDRYPDWYPDVIREVEVLERDGDGLPSRAHTWVHLAFGPLAGDFRFEITVTVEADAVILSRIPDSASDPERLEVHWHLAPGELGVEVAARLEHLPRFIPVGGVGDSVAQGFADAARRVLDGSRPKASASSS